MGLSYPKEFARVPYYLFDPNSKRTYQVQLLQLGPKLDSNLEVVKSLVEVVIVVYLHVLQLVFQFEERLHNKSNHRLLL